MTKKTKTEVVELGHEPFSDQYERFCQEYLKDLNQTQAAIRAGYAESGAKNQGYRLMQDDRIQARIDSLCAERAERTKIDADYVLTTIRDTVERCRQAEPVMEFDHASKSMVKTGEWKFEHGGVLKGCELLGKHLKLFTEKHEHTGADGGPIEMKNASRTDEELDAKIAELTKRLGAIPT